MSLTKEQEQELLNEIKQELNPTLIIKDLAQMPGYENMVSEEEHKVSFDKNIGQYKVQVGNRNLNITDYLTKQVGMSFSDTKAFVFNRYELQQSGDISDKAEIDLEANMQVNYKINERESNSIVTDFVKNHIVGQYESLDLLKLKYNPESPDEKPGRLPLGSKTDSNNVPPSLVLATLKAKKAFTQNALYSENIYISAPTDSKVKTLWLDIDDTTIDKLPETATAIQTSKNCYQVFIKLDDWVSIDEVKVMKDFLTHELDGDIRAKGYIQPMRLPGFYNLKPKHIENGSGFMVKVVQESFAEHNTKALMQKSLEFQELNSEKPVNEVIEHKGFDSQSQTFERKPVNYGLSHYQKGQSQSENDFSYAIYLVKRGRTVDEITDALLNEREDIYSKKGKWAEGYARSQANSAYNTVIQEFADKSKEEGVESTPKESKPPVKMVMR